MPLCAVAFDPNSHGAGQLMPQNPQTVFCEGIYIIDHVSPAYPDGLSSKGPPHTLPATAAGSPTVFAYGKPVHRLNDPRICGAVTIVTNQSTVFANGQ